ncbi:MAG: hypothetical protein ACFB0E_14850 [Leptolyngbyaceae cyanobacterium]
MLKQILLGTLLSSVLVLPGIKGSTAANLQVGQKITSQSDNGPAPVKNSEPQLEAGESPGESFTVGTGSAFFSFADFPEAVAQPAFLVEVNPGDSYLSLGLPEGVNLTIDEQETITAMISEGEALSIAYSHDMANDIFAFTRFTPMRVAESQTPAAVPEPSLNIAAGVVLLAGLTKRLSRKE